MTHILLGDPRAANLEATRLNASLLTVSTPLPEVTVHDGLVGWMLWDEAVRALEQPVGVVRG